ncbi:hypothetical protein [Streptomyces boninensis]|uniref:hypothetical protein n=1 Tax=Streptomyces boninensis TaxID=2039455 RepID=UPI003B21A710
MPGRCPRKTDPVSKNDVTFSGGPMDGRTLPVQPGLTGQPPKTYRIPVPDPDGGAPTVLMYRREPLAHSRLLRLPRGWVYVYDPDADPDDGRPKWPWSRRR